MKNRIYLFFIIIFSLLSFSAFCEPLTGKNRLTGNSQLTGESSLTGDDYLTGSDYLTGNDSLTEGEGESVGTYRSTVRRTTVPTTSSTAHSTVRSTVHDTYSNGYGKYLEATLSNNPNARADFARYFSDWQWSGQRQDFFTYAESRAEQERRIALTYDAALAKFGIGTAIVATTWIVSYILPGGTIYQAAVLVIAKAVTAEAVGGAASGAVISAGIAYLQGKRGDELIHATVEGAADGYLVGAVTGLVSGGVGVARMAKSATKIDDVYTVFGNRVYDRQGREILSRLDDDSAARLVKGLEKCGRRSDDAIGVLRDVSRKNPEKLNLAIRHIEAKGIESVYELKKWGGRIPKWLSREVIELEKQLHYSRAKAAVEACLAKGRIRLSTRQLDSIRQSPSVLDDLVQNYTGKKFSEGFLEFFARLHPSQVEEIWNYSKAVRDFIKNKGIRAGGVHEWLLCEKFCEFLTDPKWGKDGKVLAALMSKLTQKTGSVYMENVEIIMKDGTKKVFPKWTHELESMMTLGNPKNPNSLIHNAIRDAIEKSSSAEELLVNLDSMVKQKFSKETYAEFSKALSECLK